MGNTFPQLHRQLGTFGATMMGLGSIVGTGVFVSIGIAAGVAGPAVLAAIALAAVVALCNALSSAQLAASHPVSGGTYEYGYEYLNPTLGFTAGWMFLLAKCASAATAALGCAGYLLHALNLGDGRWLAPLAVTIAAALTIIVLGGIRRSSATNIIMVCITLGSLILFVLAGAARAWAMAEEHLTPFFGDGPGERSGAAAGLLQASALMFVAYTGYGRIATLSEEVRDPRRTIPRAIVATLLVSALLYVSVGAVAVASFGADALGSATQERAAPLELVARQFDWSWVSPLVAVGAVTAMLGVLLNLVLGLSRVLLAMGRRGDMPGGLAKLNKAQTTPYRAVIVVGVIVMALAAIGSVRVTWSFSAFTVLIYYAITNMAALRLPRDQRLFSPAFAWGGLIACLFLAFWVDRQIWLAGLALLAAGWVWHFTARWIVRRSSRDT